MRRLVWFNAGRKPIMLVLSWRGSNKSNFSHSVLRFIKSYESQFILYKMLEPQTNLISIFTSIPLTWYCRPLWCMQSPPRLCPTLWPLVLLSSATFHSLPVLKLQYSRKIFQRPNLKERTTLKVWKFIYFFLYGKMSKIYIKLFYKAEDKNYSSNTFSLVIIQPNLMWKTVRKTFCFCKYISLKSCDNVSDLFNL
jgi:hypothetical protein